MTKFLTWEEAFDQADSCFKFEEGVYGYKLNGKQTLIENGKVLVQDVDNCWWYAKGVYRYALNDEEFEVDLNKKQKDMKNEMIKEVKPTTQEVEQDLITLNSGIFRGEAIEDLLKSRMVCQKAYDIYKSGK
jgi:hypothetical protein